MHKIFKFSVFAFALIILATANINAQFSLISVEQLNFDTLGTCQTGANILHTEQGNIVVAWGDAQEVNPYFNVFMAVSTDFGQTFCEPIKVNDNVGYALTGGEDVIGIAENSLGYQVFCWTDMRHGTSNKDVYGRIRGYNGMFSPVFRINDDQTFFHQYLPRIIQVGNSDTLIAAWQDGRLCYQGCLSVFASMSTDGGQNWETNIRASVQPFGNETSGRCAPSMAVGNDGRVMVAFRNNVDHYREIYSARSDSDFTSFDAPVQVDSSGWWLPVCPATSPAIIQHSSGDWVCAYANGRTGTYKIYTARSADNGISFGDETLVGGDQWQNYPQLVEIGYGWLLVAFQEKLPNQENTRIVGSISYDAGMTWGPLFQISDDAVSVKSNIQIAYDGINNLYAVWVDNRSGDKNIFFAILEAQVTSVDNNADRPESISILRAYSNPFNAQTVISYTLSHSTRINLSIYNIMGQRVATLVEGRKEIGEHSVIWNAVHKPSGIYFARLETSDRIKSMKVILLK
ncbi:MAG: T9SS type A sorting domain-containing protein [Candidatus Zixiibacteriota bacterium]|nr:MAG: T9SS type A sorting domain-containing protein [candidate division Zixibacteria bacterium]